MSGGGLSDLEFSLFKALRNASVASRVVNLVRGAFSSRPFGTGQGAGQACPQPGRAPTSVGGHASVRMGAGRGVTAAAMPAGYP